MRFRSLGALGAFAVLSALAIAIPASGALGQGLGQDRTDGSAKNRAATGNYIVQMVDPPVVAYDGGIADLKATKPAKGTKIDPRDSAVVKYAAHLDAKHAAALSKVGGAQKLYDYHYSYNGFAAKLSAAQAAQLKGVDGVVSVSKDEMLELNTSSTPSFLGINKPGGLWDKAGGVGAAGEDVIIGIVDSGVWPEHPSFSDRTGTGPNGQDGKLGYQQIPGWHGKCTPGEAFTASDCNQKLIGAQYFNAGFGADRIADHDFLSPRDWGGHGSHTASTAGGNNGVAATGDAAAFGSISGMAPRARIASYKVCWEDEGDGGCSSSDSVAAIDQAVADGVDVINFSISGSRTSFLDPVEVAYLFAADAGVFVSASAGNTAGASTVAHPSPWLITVAASTHDRGGTGTVTLGNGTTFTGASLAANSVTGPLVDSQAAGAPGADATQVRLCYPGSLDPAKVTGKIVICDRGVISRTDKSFAVKEAGGTGMILFNRANIGVNADLHFVPTIHIECADAPTCSARATTKAYAATAGATATISKGQVTTVPAPFMAGFSSAGPLRAGDGDLLKPDVTAPGVDVLAAVAPPGNRGRLFDLYSGTSMSSPHVAGLGAVLAGLHPDWSPMMIKSSLVTTGYNARNGDVFRYGGGHVDPNKAADPGLVYDSGFGDWLAFLRGTGQLANPNNRPQIDPSDLNMPSIAIGQLAGKQTVTRKVTNVGSQAETYVASVTLAGINAVVSPATFTIAPGATQAYTVEFTRTTATLNSYALGFLTLTGSKGHVVRSPIALKPVALSAPASISKTGTAGSTTYGVTFGYDGSFGASVRGLIAADKRPGTVTDDPTNSFNTVAPDSSQGIVVHEFTVPSGSTYARFSLFDAETDGDDDLDLWVYRNGVLIASSEGGTSAEEVNLVDPAAGAYKVYVHGWQTDGPDAIYSLFGWVLGSTAAGNATVAVDPSTATTGGNGSVTFSWTGLEAGNKYLGRIVYSGSSGMPLTTVRIDG